MINLRVSSAKSAQIKIPARCVLRDIDYRTGNASNVTNRHVLTVTLILEDATLAKMANFLTQLLEAVNPAKLHARSVAVKISA